MIFNFNSSGSGGDGSVRYDAETDMIQLKDDTGNWQDWKYAGLLWDGYLFNNGDEVAKATGGWSLSVKGTLGSDCYIKNTGTALKFWLLNGGAKGKSVIATERAIDFSKFSKVRIKGYYAASVESPTMKFGFGASRDTVDVALKTWTGINSSKATFDTTIDISQYQHYPAKYFMISFECSATTYVDFESTEIEFLE